MDSTYISSNAYPTDFSHPFILFSIVKETEDAYREKLVSLEAEKNGVEQRLQSAHRALDLADSHLKQEIEKIKTSLEQEYNHLYEHDQKKHQQELHQLHQQLTNEFNKQRSTSPSINSLQDIEEMQKKYRTEVDRLYRKIKFFFLHFSKPLLFILQVKILN